MRYRPTLQVMIVRLWGDRRICRRRACTPIGVGRVDQITHKGYYCHMVINKLISVSPSAFLNI